jgi:hypothetical protein
MAPAAAWAKKLEKSSAINGKRPRVGPLAQNKQLHMRKMENFPPGLPFPSMNACNLNPKILFVEAFGPSG